MRTFLKTALIGLNFLFTFFISLSVYSQSIYELYSLVHPSIDIKEYPPSKVDCKGDNKKNGENYIWNNEFKSDVDVNNTNPFANNRVPYWVETHGTPARNNFIDPPITNPPTGFSNYASMYSWVENEKVLGEGIAQVIPMIKKGTICRMSFYKKLADLSNKFDVGMDKFFIVLAHCSDYEKLHTYPDYDIPPMPGGSQIIYAEGDLKNPFWEQMFAEFTAEDDYDLVWIFPKQSDKTNLLLGVDFTGLVITDNFANGIFLCNIPRQLSGCNYVPNPGFQLLTPSPGGGAFFQNLVDQWNDTHGTSDLNVYNIAPPLANINYASMGVGHTPVYPATYSEGIASKIVTLTQGNNYVFSFFIATSAYNGPPALPNTPNVVFNVALINCQNFPNAFTGATVAPLTNPNQIIYCENLGVVGNSNWRHIVVTFTANANYNMIRVYPDQTIASLSNRFSWIHFAMPEIHDISFDAGPNPPVPVPAGNCVVNVGPAIPNICPVANSYYGWTSPAGVITPAQPNQQMPVDESIPGNVGTWTLGLIVPDAVVPANPCFVDPMIPLFATITVPACVPEVWPKIYSYVREPRSLVKDNNGNFFVGYAGAVTATQIINHVGPFPTVSPGNFCVHYSSGGITNWYQSSGTGSTGENFVLQNGDIRLGNNYYANANSVTDYYNGLTGVLVSPPSLVPPNETIIAQTSTGGFITTTQTTINVRTSSGSNSYNITGGMHAFFNSVTNNLFIADYQVANVVFSQYQLSGNTLTLVNTITFTGNSNAFRLVEVDNLDRAYFVTGNQLQLFSFASSTFTPLVITNFTNSNIGTFYSDNHYTENRCLVFNQSQQNIYSIDLLNLSCRKIATTNFDFSPGTLPMPYWYSYQGNDVYIAGQTGSNAPYDITIGSQLIPALGQYTHSVFFTKLNLLTDFTARNTYANTYQSASPLAESPGMNAVSVFPNPASNNIRLTAKSPIKEIEITNLMLTFTKKVKVNNQTQFSLNIKYLKPGIYNFKILTNSGITNQKVFISN